MFTIAMASQLQTIIQLTISTLQQLTQLLLQSICAHLQVSE